MHSIEIQEINTTLHFPEDATELSTEQFLAFAKHYLLYSQEVIDWVGFKTALVYDFLNMKRTADLSKNDNQDVIENVHQLSQLIEPFFEDIKVKGKLKKSLKMNFFLQLLPKIEVNGTDFYGPSNALFNTVWGEYLQAQSLFNDYAATGDEDKLNLLIATLYRPKKKNISSDLSDKRSDFDTNRTEFYATKIAALAPHIKYAIFLYFASSQHFLVNNTALDIGGGIALDISVLFKQNTGASTAKGLGMLSTTFSIAETKVFGSMKDVSKQSTIDIFAYLVDQHYKMKEIQAKTPKK